jgi:hypothetical protein
VFFLQSGSIKVVKNAGSKDEKVLNVVAEAR